MKMIAGIIIYFVIFWLVKNFVNAQSIKIIKKEVFDWMYQVFIFIGAVLFFIYTNFEVKSGFDEFLKYGILILFFADVIIYFVIKFKEYKFGWALISIMMDVLAVPVSLTVFLVILGLVENRNVVYCLNDD